MQTFREWALWNRWEIRRVLGFQITERQTVLEVLSKFLKKVGYKLESRRLGSRGARQRVYQIANLGDAYRQGILEALTQRFEALLSSSAGEGVSTTDSI